MPSLFNLPLIFATNDPKQSSKSYNVHVERQSLFTNEHPGNIIASGKKPSTAVCREPLPLTAVGN